MKVLVADDEAVSRKLLENTLRRWEYEVVCAQDGLEALEILKQPEAPKLAILDWQMPDINGGQLAAKLRALGRELNRPHTTIVVLSAAIEPAPTEHAIELSFDRWLTKPVSQSELALVLGSVHDSGECSEHVNSRWTEPLARLGGRRQLLVQLAQTWSAGWPELLKSLQTALNQGRNADVIRLTHLISGQASIFDAHELAATAKSLEKQARANSIDGSLLTALDVECRTLGRELEVWLAQENAVVL